MKVRLKTLFNFMTRCLVILYLINIVDVASCKRNAERFFLESIKGFIMQDMF